MNAPCSCTSAPVTVLYEQEELAEVTGGTLRPGGLALTAEILTACNLAPGATVLDVGCGPGHTAALMASAFQLRPTGLDPSATMLAKAACSAPGVALIQAEATAIPCRSHCFAAVISECVLSLTGDIDTSLREMARVLRPGGLLLLTDIFCKQRQAAALPGLCSCITQALPLERVAQALQQAGFTLLTLRDRSDLLKQLAGQIIFTYGSLERFWQLFLGEEEARLTCCALATASLGYYVLIAQRGAPHG